MPVKAPAVDSPIPVGNAPAEIVCVIASPSASVAATVVSLKGALAVPNVDKTFVSAAVAKVGALFTVIAVESSAESPEPFVTFKVYGSFESF